MKIIATYDVILLTKITLYFKTTFKTNEHINYAKYQLTECALEMSKFNLVCFAVTR